MATMNHAGSPDPSPWIVRFAPLVAAGSRVLDAACGEGRHTRWFAARGASVLAVDRDPAALALLVGIPNVTTRAIDLETSGWPLAGERFGAIVVVNYLHRPHLPALLEALESDGVLLYETFAAGNEAYGRPRNPAFLLEPSELLHAVGERLTIVAFEQGRVEQGGRVAVVQRIAAVGAARRWPPALPPGEPG